MKEIWDIKLYEYDNGSYAVRITGEGKSIKAKGRTPQEAYKNAERELVIKPAFFIID